MNSSSAESIGGCTLQCLQQFEQITNVLRESGHLDLRLPVSLVTNEANRFRKWAIDTGAIPSEQGQHIALEIRMSRPGDSMLVNQMLEFLRSLSRDLESVQQICSGERPNHIDIREVDRDVDEGEEDGGSDEAGDEDVETEEISEVVELFETCQDFVSVLIRLGETI